MNELNPYESPKSDRERGKFEIDWPGIGQALMILAVGAVIGVVAACLTAFIVHR